MVAGRVLVNSGDDGTSFGHDDDRCRGLPEAMISSLPRRRAQKTARHVRLPPRPSGRHPHDVRADPDIGDRLGKGCLVELRSEDDASCGLTRARG